MCVFFYAILSLVQISVTTTTIKIQKCFSDTKEHPNAIPLLVTPTSTPRPDNR